MNILKRDTKLKHDYIKKRPDFSFLSLESNSLFFFSFFAYEQVQRTDCDKKQLKQQKFDFDVR